MMASNDGSRQEAANDRRNRPGPAPGRGPEPGGVAAQGPGGVAAQGREPDGREPGETQEPGPAKGAPEDGPPPGPAAAPAQGQDDGPRQSATAAAVSPAG